MRTIYAVRVTFWVLFCVMASCTSALPASAKPSQDELNRALLAAVQNRYLDGTRELIRQGADIECHGQYDETPLMHAAAKGDLELMNLLLDLKADVNGASSAGTALSWAAASGHIEAMTLLLGRGADVRIRGSYGGGPLTAAVLTNHRRAAEILIERGADVNERDERERSTLYGAVENQFMDIVALLVSNGADLDAADVDGTTPLMEAVSQYNLPGVKLLLDAGADVNIKNRSGQSAFIVAMLRESGYPRRMILLDTVMGVEGKHYYPADYDGRTRIRDRVMMAHMLLDHGADVDACDACGCSVLGRAIGRNTEDNELTLYLKSRGAILRLNSLCDPPGYLASW